MVVSVGLPLTTAIFEKAMMGIYDADIEAGIRAGLPTYKIYESLILQISAMPVISCGLFMNPLRLDGLRQH